MKGYRLWCPNPKSPKFAISRDVTFDESYMLYPRKDPSSLYDSDKDENTQKQVRVEIRSSISSQPSHSTTQFDMVDIIETTQIEPVE